MPTKETIIDTVAGYGQEPLRAMHRMQEEAREKELTVRQNLNGVTTLISSKTDIELLYAIWLLAHRKILSLGAVAIGPIVERDSLRYK
jgi:hypothetical protein